MWKNYYGLSSTKFYRSLAPIKQWRDLETMLVIGRMKTYELTLKGREQDKEEEQLMFSRAKDRNKQKDYKFAISKVRC